MTTLTDRLYWHTIPEHGPSPRVPVVVVPDQYRDMDLSGLTGATNALDTATRRMEVLHGIARRCAGHIRRQARRHRE